jgi:hypothetical protein
MPCHNLARCESWRATILASRIGAVQVCPKESAPRVCRRFCTGGLAAKDSHRGVLHRRVLHRRPCVHRPKQIVDFAAPRHRKRPQGMISVSVYLQHTLDRNSRKGPSMKLIVIVLGARPAGRRGRLLLYSRRFAARILPGLRGGFRPHPCQAWTGVAGGGSGAVGARVVARPHGVSRPDRARTKEHSSRGGCEAAVSKDGQRRGPCKRPSFATPCCARLPGMRFSVHFCPVPTARPVLPIGFTAATCCRTVCRQRGDRARGNPEACCRWCGRQSPPRGRNAAGTRAQATCGPA